jgi:hypothetical protein
VLDAYFDAFEGFLTTGNREQLTGYIETDTNLAALRVYRNGYLKTCIDALASSYPAVSSLVGKDCFRTLARTYVEAYPPTKGTLVGYGGHLPDFLRSRTDELGLPYLPDAAAIDAAWLRCYFAEDAVALTAADVEAMSSEGGDISATRVSLTPATSVVSLNYDLAATWAHIREQRELKSRVSLPRGDNTVMLWRLDRQIHIKALDPGELALLEAFTGGATLGEAAARALEAEESFDLATTFAALLNNQILQLESHRA